MPTYEFAKQIGSPLPESYFRWLANVATDTVAPVTMTGTWSDENTSGETHSIASFTSSEASSDLELCRAA